MGRQVLNELLERRRGHVVVILHRLLLLRCRWRLKLARHLAFNLAMVNAGPLLVGFGPADSIEQDFVPLVVDCFFV